MIFENREMAGQILGELLMKYKDTNVLVVALPRGGVPVGAEVAKALNAKMDALVVRKIGVPGNPELAIGAVAPWGVWYLDKLAVHNLKITREQLDEIAKKEVEELIRRQLVYRGDKAFPVIKGKIVILTDDGIATGSTMRAAIRAIAKQKPKKLVLAVPVAPRDIMDNLKSQADEFICPEIIRNFTAVGAYYRKFPQVTDEEVKKLLRVES